MGYIDYSVDVHKSRGGKLSTILKKYYKPILYVVSVLLFLQLMTRYFILYPLTVQNNAMFPTLSKGNRIFLLYPHLSDIHSGDVVLLNLKESNYQLLCRIVATEGERVELIDKQLFVNGKEVKNILSQRNENNFPPSLHYRDNLPPTDIRSGYFFCLNDNRTVATDSRQWGPFSQKQIVGKAVFKGFLFFSIK